MTPRSPRAWWPVAVAMVGIGWGGNQFTPLLGLYTETGGFSRLDVDVFLGAYVLGLVPGLLVASAWSDHRGRRPVLALGVVASAVGSGLLAGGDGAGYPLIFAGRVASGVAVGVAMSVGSAWISELTAHDPGARPGAAARRGAMSLTVGFALGPAVGGALAQLVDPPLLWPFVVHAVLCAPVLALLWTAPESRVREVGDLRWLHRLRVPAAGHRRFVRVVLPMAPWVFGTAGVAYAIVPAQVADAVGDGALVYTVALTVTTLVTGVLVQPIARRLDDVSSSRAVAVSLVLVAVGVLLAAATAATGSPWLAVPVALLLGAAYGIAVVSGLLEVQRIAEPDELAGLTGVYYALTYVGFLLPAALAGLERWFDYPAMLIGVAALALACTAVVVTGSSRHLPMRSTSTR